MLPTAVPANKDPIMPADRSVLQACSSSEYWQISDIGKYWQISDIGKYWQILVNPKDYDFVGGVRSPTFQILW